MKTAPVEATPKDEDLIRRLERLEEETRDLASELSEAIAGLNRPWTGTSEPL